MRQMSDDRNVAIGRLMGEAPDIVWAVMNGDETGTMIDFDGRHAEHEANRWFDRHKREFPSNVEANAYHLVRQERWPDYLGEFGDCAASSRFINWAFRQTTFAHPENVILSHQLIVRGMTVQEALATYLLPAVDDAPARQ